jgi:hypothetical protein
MLKPYAEAELLSNSGSIIHHQFRALPPAIEIDESLPLADVDDFPIKQTERHHAIFRASPSPINRPAELQVLKGSG